MMDFLQVAKTCLDFSIAYNGTIQSYGEKHEKLKIQSRTTRTEILVEREADEWQLTLILNSTDEEATAKQTVSTKEHLCTQLARFWRDETAPPPLPPRMEDELLLARQEAAILNARIVELERTIEHMDNRFGAHITASTRCRI